MKLSTRSRYGTRMMLDLAQHYKEGPVQIGQIAKRQDISVKYLEQLIIPLKKANFIKSTRGPKGGHMLAKSPKEITIGQIVEVLEGGIDLTVCVGDTDVCERSAECLIRDTWREATKAMYEKLNSISLSKIIKSQKHC
jgi:Rrf2 family iron-sulfur cluster assembly transcriptional regulator